MDKRKPDLMVRMYLPEKVGGKMQNSTIELFRGSQFPKELLGERYRKSDVRNLYRVRIDRVWFPSARPITLFRAEDIIQHVLVNGVLPQLKDDHE